MDVGKKGKNLRWLYKIFLNLSFESKERIFDKKWGQDENDFFSIFFKEEVLFSESLAWKLYKEKFAKSLTVAVL